jgi:hypothetical protein
VGAIAATNPLPPLTVEEIHALEPTYLGPTWKTNPDGSWFLPQRTLGWQIAGWCAEWLNGEDGKPWKFTREQLRFLLWWYAVDEAGRFIYRTGVLQRMKGWGKDPLLAVICLVEWVGPSRFSHFAADGSPVGVALRKSWVQVTAVNQSQTDNTMEFIPGLMSDRFKAKYRVKDGVELIRAMGGKCRLQAVTSSYRAIEGKRTTFTLLNETHHWVAGNKGIKMYETIDGNSTKLDSRYLAITNAYLPGEDSVAEIMREGYDKTVEGRAVDVGLMYDSIEAHPRTPLTVEAMLIVIPKIRGDAVWLRVETILQSIQNSSLSASRSRRMWLNQIVAEEDALYGPDQLAAMEDLDLELRPGDAIVAGFDGGKTDDDTALVAIRISDQAVFKLGHWYKPDGQAGENWEVDRESVDSEVHEMFRLYEVEVFYADVALWESYITDWAADYGEGLTVKSDGRNAVSWDMRSSLKRVTLAHERLMRSIFDAKLLYDGDLSMKRHMLNARRRTNNYGLSFGKESRESPRKVDLYAALLLAHEALYDLRTRGKKEKKRSGRGYFV